MLFRHPTRIERALPTLGAWSDIGRLDRNWVRYWPQTKLESLQRIRFDSTECGERSAGRLRTSGVEGEADIKPALPQVP